MLNILKKKLSLFLALMLAIAFISSYQSANAWQIGVTIYIGKGSDCSGKGICKIKIDFDLKTAATSGGNVVVLKGDAELKGNKLVIKFKDKLDERMMGEDGKYTVTIGPDFPSFEHIKDESGNEMLRESPTRASTGTSKSIDKSSPKILSIVPGDYQIKGNTLTLKTSWDIKKSTK
jgi:hypothetical protein